MEPNRMKLCHAMWMTIVVLFALWSAPLTPAHAQFRRRPAYTGTNPQKRPLAACAAKTQWMAASSIDLYSGRSRGHPGRFRAAHLLTCRPPNWKSSSRIWRNGLKC